MRLIFCGTPRFAVPTLERLVKEGHSVELVVTNPDEPSGRGHEVKAPPVKQVAQRLHLVVFQPGRFRDPATQAFLSAFQPDAMIIVAYGHILPPWALQIPRLGCFNLHASLLPKYRGAAPIPWAIIHGEREAGVTTMKLDPGVDTGDVLLVQHEPILETDTSATLAERLSTVGAELMARTLREIESGEIKPRPQDSALATYAPMIKKEDAKIDWSTTAEEIGRRVRGFDPWPGAFTNFRGKTLHIWKALPGGIASTDSAPGTLEVDRRQVRAVCGEKSLLILEEVQFQDRKRLSAVEFARGTRIQPGEKLGD